MKIALVDTVRKRKYYPIALLKIGAWLKSEGNHCEVFYNELPEAGEFNEIWITTVFTFDIKYSLAFVREAKKRADRVIVGGIAATLMPDIYEKEGVEVHVGLHPEAEKFIPDYSLLEEMPDYCITHTSRGCIRKCEFCMVRVVEPKFFNKRGWEADVHPSSKEIVFYDNNWSAKPNKIMREDAEKIKGLMSSQGVVHVDFNQSLDCRVITEEKADIITSIPISPIRLAFDNNDEEEPLVRVIKLLAERGENKFMIDMLYNFEESPVDIYRRARRIALLSEELNMDNINIFPMKYAPIRELNSRKYVGKKWTPQLLTRFRHIVSTSSVAGTISPHGIEGFEFWYGKSEKDFMALLNYSKFRLLINRRLGKSRTMSFRRNRKEKHKQ